VLRERRRPVKNASLEVEQFRRRAFLGFAVVALCLIVLAGWYFKLQVLDHQTYAAQSEANRIKPRPIVPGRGLILDRKGRVLADNVPEFRLDVMPEEAGDIDTLLKQLATIVPLSEDEIAAFKKARETGRSHRPVPLKLKLTEADISVFEVNRWRFPGVDVVPYFGRIYPYGDLFTHVIGYVGRVDAKDKERLGNLEGAISHVGKSGLERYYEDSLRGKVGYERIETNADGRPLRSLGTEPASAGQDLKLSIDLDLQRAMVEAFGTLEGTGIAVDPRTGEILAMVSLPSFDENLFVNGISHEDFKALQESPSRPQFNRAVLGGVAPGSTIKPFLALAGLDSGTRTPSDTVMSTGMFYLPGSRRGFGDSHRGGHGLTDVRKSIYESVNTYYYKLSLDMGIDKMVKYFDLYGFGKPTGVDLSGEIAGILPSPEWKRNNMKGDRRWYPFETVNASIGQGLWKVTPLQLVQALGALANGGYLRRPHFVKETRSGPTAQWIETPLTEPVRISNSPSNLQVIREGMIGTVHGHGTATNIRSGLTYLIASKTGTAQVVSRRGNAAVNPRSLPMHLRHRALFEAYAPANNPTIAVVVAVEGGGYGADTAAPIVRKVMDAWINGVMPDGSRIDPNNKVTITPATDPRFADVQGSVSGGGP
jgi:penicillin-binding protein 2